MRMSKLSTSVTTSNLLYIKCNVLLIFIRNLSLSASKHFSLQLLCHWRKKKGNSKGPWLLPPFPKHTGSNNLSSVHCVEFKQELYIFLTSNGPKELQAILNMCTPYYHMTATTPHLLTLHSSLRLSEQELLHSWSKHLNSVQFVKGSPLNHLTPFHCSPCLKSKRNIAYYTLKCSSNSWIIDLWNTNRPLQNIQAVPSCWQVVLASLSIGYHFPVPASLFKNKLGHSLFL